MADLEIAFAAGKLQLSEEAGIGRLTLARAHRMNAVDAAMWAELPQALAWLVETAASRIIILSGEGDDFSAGADISEFATVRHDAKTSRAYDTLNVIAFRALRDCPVPTIALIRGICYGGALGLAAASDIRLSSRDARFAVPAARLGLTYPVDAIGDIIEAFGPQAARRLLYTATAIDAEEAYRLGFLSEIASPDDIAALATGLAASMAANAPLTIRASKAAIRAGLSGRFEDRERAESYADLTFESEDYREGRLAFREKRAPRFTGR